MSETFTGLTKRRTLANQMATLITMLGITGLVGNIFFVRSTTGSNGAGRGTRPSQALATLNYAIGLCTANNGDVVVLLPSHAEVFTSAVLTSPITLDKAGVRVVGAGVGANRPTLTASGATTDTITMSAASCSLEGVIIDFTTIDAVVAGVTADATDLSFISCEFRTNAAAAGVVSGITLGGTTACDRFRIINCRFLGPAVNSGTTTTAQVTITAGVDYLIEGNYFTGKVTQNITNGATVLRGNIHNNRFVTATGTKSINMAAASTPFITNNRFNVPSGTAPIVAAAGFVAGNVYSAAAGVTAGTASTI